MKRNRDLLGRIATIAVLFICSSTARGQDQSVLRDEDDLGVPWMEGVSTNSVAAASDPFIDTSVPPPISIQPRNSFLTDVASASKWPHTRGVDFHASLKAEASSNFHSGLSGDGTDYRSLLETDVSIDMQKATGWPGAQVQASFHDYFGSNATDRLMGDAQGFSNIDSYPANRIYELWFQQSLAHSALRIKLGRIDANTEFAYVENATEFLNSSMGYSPTILDMHSYPNPRLGAMVGFAPSKFLTFSAAIFRCLPSGSMMLGEAGKRWRISKRVSVGRLAIGFWIHPHTLDGFNGMTQFGVHGYYAVLEQTLWKRAGEFDDDSRGVRAFAQWGDTNPWFNGIARHLGTVSSGPGHFPPALQTLLEWGSRQYGSARIMIKT